MPATAAARARSAQTPLPEARAREMIGSLRTLVAASQSRIAPGQVLVIAYTVADYDRQFTFPAQPFYVVREITLRQYLQALPKALRHGRITSKHYYEIHTD